VKAERTPVFTPVTVTIETEQELAALAAVLRHAGISKAAGFDKSEWEALNPFHVESMPDFHNAFKRLDTIWEASKRWTRTEAK
jgi:hypothetical protein